MAAKDKIEWLPGAMLAELDVTCETDVLEPWVSHGRGRCVDADEIGQTNCKTLNE